MANPNMNRYEIAGLQIEMEPHGRTERQAAAYAAPAQGPADVTIQCDIAALMAHNPRINTEELAEYLGTGARFSVALLDHEGFMLHSSAVILDGKAWLFSAPSGTGKSTHTEKWLRLFGAAYLNDDKPALRLVDGVWMAYGTPWSGKYDLSTPQGVPLGGIAFLRRGDENSIRPVGADMAVQLFMSQTLRKLGLDAMQTQLTLMDQLLRAVPVWDLECLNNDDAAIVSHEAMTGVNA